MSALRFLIQDESKQMTVSTLPGTQAIVVEGDRKSLSVGSLDGHFALGAHGVPAKNYMDFEPSAMIGLPDNQILAANIMQAALLEFDGNRFKATKKWGLRSKTVFGGQLKVAADASGEVMVAAARDYILRLKTKGKSPYKHVSDAAIWGLAVSRDGKTVANGREDGRLEIRDAETLEVIAGSKPCTCPFLAMAFSNDGGTLAFSDDAWQLFLMDMASGEVTQLDAAVGKVIGLSYLSDGRLVVVNLSRMVRLFDGGTCVATWDLSGDLGDRYIQGAAVLGDESGIVLACEQKGLAFQSFT